MWVTRHACFLSNTCSFVLSNILPSTRAFWLFPLFTGCESNRGKRYQVFQRLFPEISCTFSWNILHFPKTSHLHLHCSCIWKTLYNVHDHILSDWFCFNEAAKSKTGKKYRQKKKKREISLSKRFSLFFWCHLDVSRYGQKTWHQ